MAEFPPTVLIISSTCKDKDEEKWKINKKPKVILPFDLMKALRLIFTNTTLLVYQMNLHFGIYI